MVIVVKVSLLDIKLDIMNHVKNLNSTKLQRVQKNHEKLKVTDSSDTGEKFTRSSAKSEASASTSQIVCFLCEGQCSRTEKREAMNMQWSWTQDLRNVQFCRIKKNFLQSWVQVMLLHRNSYITPHVSQLCITKREQYYINKKRSRTWENVMLIQKLTI